MMMHSLIIDNSELSAEEKRDIYRSAHVVLIPYGGGLAVAHSLWIQTIYEVRYLLSERLHRLLMCSYGHVPVQMYSNTCE
jgi:hypothetical protein